MLAFDPVTTIAAVIRTKQPPNELFARAMPLTLVFLLATTAALSVLYGPGWRRFGAVSTFAGLERQTLAPGGGA